jgi:hypothetical protein
MDSAFLVLGFGMARILAASGFAVLSSTALGTASVALGLSLFFADSSVEGELMADATYSKRAYTFLTQPTAP